MFAELASIVSAISAINSTIATLKEGKANADDVARLIGRFGTQQQKLDQFERKQKLRKPLTPQAAIQLSLARRNANQAMRNLKDLCLMAGAPDIWRDAERSMRESERQQAQFLKDIVAKRRARKNKIHGISIAVFLVVSAFVIAGGAYVVFDGYQQAQRDKAKSALQNRRDVLRNIRQCGRGKC